MKAAGTFVKYLRSSIFVFSNLDNFLMPRILFVQVLLLFIWGKVLISPQFYHVMVQIWFLEFLNVITAINFGKCGNFGEGWFLNKSISYSFMCVSVWLKAWVCKCVYECVKNGEYPFTLLKFMFYSFLIAVFFIVKCLCQACSVLYCSSVT